MFEEAQTLGGAELPHLHRDFGWHSVEDELYHFAQIRHLTSQRIIAQFGFVQGKWRYNIGEGELGHGPSAHDYADVCSISGTTEFEFEEFPSLVQKLLFMWRLGAGQGTREE